MAKQLQAEKVNNVNISVEENMNQLQGIEAIEKRLWNAADTLRTNSNYASNEYFMPVNWREKETTRDAVRQSIFD